jgi:hypothetical protein
MSAFRPKPKRKKEPHSMAINLPGNVVLALALDEKGQLQLLTRPDFTPAKTLAALAPVMEDLRVRAVVDRMAGVKDPPRVLAATADDMPPLLHP